MGNKYIEEFCDNCKSLQTHRVFKRFGKCLDRNTGAKRQKRIVSFCLRCQRRIINNSRRGKYVKHKGNHVPAI